MLYMVSQNGMRIADMHTVSVVTPEHDREGDDVYKIFVNGIEFARYSTEAQINALMKSITKFIHMSGYYNEYFCLPQEGECL